jgi:hypothetical protein
LVKLLVAGQFHYLLSLETYQAAENSIYPEHINTFGAEEYPALDPISPNLRQPPA